MNRFLDRFAYLAWPLGCLAIGLAGLANYDASDPESLHMVAALCALAALGLMLLYWKYGKHPGVLPGLVLMHGLVQAGIWFVTPLDDANAILAVLLVLLLGVATWLARRVPPLPPATFDVDARHAPMDIAILVLPMLMAANLDGGDQARALAGEFPRTLLIYFFYAWVQLSLFLVLPVRVMRHIGISAGPASLACAVVFALIHLPNPMLMTATGLAMWLFSWQYQKGRSLLILVILMAVIATTLKIAVPAGLSSDMRIGVGYLEYVAAR